MAAPLAPVLRPAGPADAAAGAAMHAACWREAYGPLVDHDLLEQRLADVDRWTAAWTAQLASGPPRVVAQAGGELVGFAVAGPPRDPEPVAPAELYALYVRRRWWGTGLGRRLWDAVRPEGACSLWVLEDNGRAQTFYRRNGFAPDGARERYDGLGAWEIRMVCR